MAPLLSPKLMVASQELVQGSGRPTIQHICKIVNLNEPSNTKARVQHKRCHCLKKNPNNMPDYRRSEGGLNTIKTFRIVLMRHLLYTLWLCLRSTLTWRRWTPGAGTSGLERFPLQSHLGLPSRPRCTCSFPLHSGLRGLHAHFRYRTTRHTLHVPNMTSVIRYGAVYMCRPTLSIHVGPNYGRFAACVCLIVIICRTRFYNGTHWLGP